MSVYCALLHHPVRDRSGKTTTTAVTTLDVHDISRTARTYGLAGYFVVTPIEPQQALVERILEHWRSGAGVERMPERRRALSICHVVSTLQDACAHIEAEAGQAPELWATAARSELARSRLAPWQARAALRARTGPVLLLFGTGHGLSDGLLQRADALLEPINGPAPDFNHLSVRAAAAITLDRLLGPEIAPEGQGNPEQD